MRERQMRELVERFLERQMRKTVMPAALGLGLALADCGHQGPPNAGPRSATLAETDEVEGELQRPDGVAVYSAPGPPRPPARYKYDKLWEFGRRTFAALDRCDFSFLRGAILSRGELSSIAAAGLPDEQSYRGMVEAWLEKLRRDFCTPPPEPVPDDPYAQTQPEPRRWVGDFEVQDALVVPAGVEWKRSVAIGLATAYVFPAGATQRSQATKTPPFTFIDFENRWRLLVK